MIDSPFVASQQQTCYACPDQWEGQLTTGHTFYFRYRSGWASLGIAGPGGDPTRDEYEVGVKHGDNLQGVFDSDEARSCVFRQLLRQRLALAAI